MNQEISLAENRRQLSDPITRTETNIEDRDEAPQTVDLTTVEPRQRMMPMTTRTTPIPPQREVPIRIQPPSKISPRNRASGSSPRVSRLTPNYPPSVRSWNQ